MIKKAVAIVASVVIVLTVCLALPSSVLADGPVGGFDRDDFERIAEEGFGDPMNNYPWAMAYFNGDLYVGTGRNVPYMLLSTLFSMTEFEYITEPRGSLGDYDWAEDMLAEIWRYHDGAWEQVYQSTVEEYPLPFPDWDYVPSEWGFRQMAVFDGAIYAASGAGFMPGRLLLKSTDGTNWEPVKTPPAMGTDARAMAVHGNDGKLYVGLGFAPEVWACATPSTTTDTGWERVADFSCIGPGENSAVLSLETFNDYLYAGTENIPSGFQVFRSTVAEPREVPAVVDPPGDWTQIVYHGAGDMMNYWAGTMEVFNNQLYVGTLSLPIGELPKGFELIRIDTSDSWELVIGDYVPRVLAPGVTIPRSPISGWPGGFANFLNFYCWSLQEHEDVLYLGTFDASSFLQFLPGGELIDLELTEGEQEAIVAALEEVITLLEDQGVDEYYIEAFERLLEAFLPTDEPVDWDEVWQVFMDYFTGGDLWKTEDGIIWWPVTLNGFGNPDNYGFRNMVGVNPVFVGMSNPFEGLEIWQAPPQGEGGATDADGITKDVYAVWDDVYATGTGFQPNTAIHIYIVGDLAWSDGDPIPADVGDGMDTVTTDDDGNFGPTLVWEAPLSPGEYDIVFDADRDGVYDAIGDFVDHPDHPGFTVLLPPPNPVGGEAYPVNKLGINQG